MVCVGIDVAKDKHDCCILDSEGTTLVDCFTIPNNMDGFKSLLQTIQDCSQKSDKIKVGLEATGHYSYNILGFLLDNNLPVYVMNPLHTNLYRKSLSLRKTKTDRVDAKTIATMLLSDVDLKSYTDTRPCSSSQPFLAERLMRSSRIPYSVLASVDRFWKRDSKKSAFGMR